MDEQFCPGDDTMSLGDDANCGTFFYQDDTLIFIRVCCRTDNCNTNDTIFREFLSKIPPPGVCVCVSIVHVW